MDYSLWILMVGSLLLFVALLPIIDYQLIRQAHATVQVPDSYLQKLFPENMTANVNDPSVVINDWANAIITPVTDKLGIWTFPLVSMAIFIGFYAAKEDFIYASIPAMILVAGELAVFPTEIGVFITLVFIAGYSGALWYGLKSGRH